MIEGDRVAIRQAAAKAIGAAASAELSGLGFVRRGRSPRYWFRDQQWWTTEVWFEPSGFSVKINLNVGVNHLWHLTDSHSLERSLGSQSAPGFLGGAMDGSAGAPDLVARAYAQEAARRVRAVQADSADDRAHLERLATVEYRTPIRGGLPVPEGFVINVANVLLANTLLGRTQTCRTVVATHRRALLSDPQRHQPWSRTDQSLTELDELEAIATSDDATTLVLDRIQTSRALLGMEPLRSPPVFLDRPPPPRASSTPQNPL